MRPKISIVVPIYNMELYVSRCLDSLLSQSFVDFEIIAVNDGSTDTTGHILDRYAYADSRVVVIHTENGGVSSARNLGLRAAKGSYIGFVDPDDWVDASMYEVMYETAVQEDAEIVMCTYIREFADHSNEKRFPYPERVSFRDQEVRSKMMRRLIGPIHEETANPEFLDAWGTVWSKLYRAELIQKNGLQFMDLSMIGSNEDSLFNIHAFYHADSFVFLNRPFYHYWRANSASITSTYNPLLESKFDKLYRHMEAFLIEKQLPEEFHSALNNRICMNTLGLGLNIMNQGNPASALKQIRLLKALISGHRLSRSFQRFDMQYCPITWRAFFMCAKLKFATGIYLMLQAINWLRVKNTRSVRLGTGTNLAGRHRDEPRRVGNHDHELLPPGRPDKHTI